MSFRYVVADDAPFIREIIKQTFTEIGAVCVGEAVNGEECLSLIDEYQPDLLILDMVMPKLNGIDCAKQLNEKYPDLQIIACSTLEFENIREKLSEIKIKTYLTKPFKKEDLKRAVQ